MLQILQNLQLRIHKIADFFNLYFAEILSLGAVHKCATLVELSLKNAEKRVFCLKNRLRCSRERAHPTNCTN